MRHDSPGYPVGQTGIHRGHILIGVLLGIATLSRIPLLSLGYGADGDAWRVARSAMTFWTTGHYEISRFPGFPLHELLMAPCVGLGGATLANLATLAAALAAIIIWRAITAHTARHPTAILAAFALCPLILISAACTMDYVWSLVCILGALRSAQKGNPVASGIWTGCAAAFRLPNGVAVLPVGVLLLAGTPQSGRIIKYAVSTLLSLAAGFLPVLVTYGLSGWMDGLRSQFTGTSLSMGDHFLLGMYRSVYAIGLVPFAIVLMIVLRGRSRFASPFNAIVHAGLTGVLAFAVLFFLFPFQREYLIPAIPFLLLVLDELSDGMWMKILLAGIVSFAFVNIDVIRHHGMRGDPGLNVRPGIVIEEWNDRHALLAERASLPRLQYTTPAIVMTGLEDSFTFENDALVRDTAAPWSSLREHAYHSRLHSALHFTSVLYDVEVTHLLNARIQVLYLTARKEYLQSLVRYDLGDRRIRSIPGD